MSKDHARKALLLGIVLFACMLYVGCDSRSADSVYAAIKEQDISKLRDLQADLKSSVVLDKYSSIVFMPKHPLEHAIMTRWYVGIDYLVGQYGVNFDFPSKRSPLTSSIYECDLESVKILVKAGAHLDRADQNGVVPAVLALGTASYPMIKYMVEAGVDYREYRAEVCNFLPLIRQTPQAQDILPLLNVP